MTNDIIHLIPFYTMSDKLTGVTGLIWGNHRTELLPFAFIINLFGACFKLFKHTWNAMS